MEVYIEGLLCDITHTVKIPLSSSAIIVMLNYCKLHNAKVVLVAPNKEDYNINGIVFDYNICLNEQQYEDMSVKCISTEEMPFELRQVSLPSLYQPDMNLVRSGLCCIVRHIVKLADRQTPDLQLVDLLGFRQGSMKMCCEVSSWTKLCEVDLPQSLSNFILDTKKMRSNQRCEKRNIVIPNDLLKLESHFTKKCLIHNDDKKRRSELKVLKSVVNRHKLNKNGFNCANLKEEADNCDNVSISKLEYEHSVFVVEEIVQLRHGIRKILVNKKVGAVTEKVSDRSDDKIVDTSLNNDTDKELEKVLEQLTYLDIEYAHVYSEGFEMTIADLILLAFIYNTVISLDDLSVQIFRHLPRIAEWAGHMMSLKSVIETANATGWNVNKFQDLLDKVERSPKEVQNNSVQFVIEADSTPHSEELELSRNARIKHKAIKPELMQAMDKIQKAGIEAVTGRHPNGEDVHIDWKNLPCHIHPREGDVPLKRTTRKCEQLENLVTAVQSIAKSGDIIVDFCSGGGHLGIVMAYLLPECKVFLVENKEESLLKACARLEKLTLKNVVLFQCNLDYFIGKFDIGVCLHACGSATDMVLQLCLNSSASFVICPCCYGGIQRTHLLSYPRSNQFQQSDLTYKDFLTLGHAADQTEFKIALENQGRHCMNLVDTDRAEYARESGYAVTLCSLQPLSCTPKNNLLIGSPQVN